VTNRRTVWLILLAAVVLRLIIAARIPLVDDEAYYWAWAQRLAWGYPDHPPAIAGLIRLTTTLLGDSPLGVRTGPVLLTLGIAWLLYDLGRLMFNSQVGALAALWFQTIPLFSIGGILSFPDAPFTFFWLLAMWALWQSRAGDRRTAWWILTGAAVGLAALSKVAAIFLAVGAAGYLAWGEPERRWWRRWEPYAAAAVAVAWIIPVLQWNAAHGDILVRKARDPYIWVQTGIPALNALAYAGAQLAYYGPLSAVLLIAALLAAWRGRRGADPRYVYVLWMTIPILGIFVAMSFDGVAKPHWTAPAYLVALLPAAALWTTARLRRSWRWAVTSAVAVNLLLVGAFGGLALWPGGPVGKELRAWPGFINEVRRELEATPVPRGGERFILVVDYQTAAQVEYHLRGTVVNTPFGFDAYEIWVPDQHLIGWNALFITADEPFPGIPIERMFRQVEELPSISFAAGGQTFRTYKVYRGIGYRGFPRPVARPI
jgi:4-amino-4-deoxy-L-arabinose transferase-like glycosyltransferase